MPLAQLVGQSLDSRLNAYYRVGRDLLQECVLNLPAFTNCLLSVVGRKSRECDATFFFPQGHVISKAMVEPYISDDYLYELIFFQTYIEDIPIFSIGTIQPFKLTTTEQISPFCELVGKEVHNSFLFKDYIVSNTLDKASLFILRELHDYQHEVYQQFNSLFDNDRLVDVLNFIHRRLETDVQLKELAEIANLSPDYISQFLKRCIGMGIQSYLIEQRLYRGLELLVMSRTPIADIAQRSGFIDQAYFTRRLKIRYKISPLRLRKKYQLLSVSQAGEGMALSK